MTLISLLFFLTILNVFSQTKMQLDLAKDDNGNIVKCNTDSIRHIHKHFKLQENKDSISFSIEIYEDSICVLNKYKNHILKYSDTLTDYTNIWGDRSDCSILCPAFLISDVNFDGYNDLIYWQSTNVNGNQWSKIYLFDPLSGNLKILENGAEDENIWASPSFDIKTKKIFCEQVCGQFGVSFKSKYLLKGNKAIPLTKLEVDTSNLTISGKGEITNEYIGQNGEWKLIKTNGRFVNKK